MQRGTREPLDLTLRLARSVDPDKGRVADFTERAYRLERSNGVFSPDVQLPWTRVLSLLRALGGGSPSEDVTAELGAVLGRFLSELVGDRRMEELRAAARAGAPFIVSIQSSATELFALPWELARLSEHGPVLGRVPSGLVRYEIAGSDTRRHEPEPPPEGGRLLFAWAAPEDEVPWEAHADAIAKWWPESFGEAARFDPDTDVLSEASLADVEAALDAAEKAGRPYRALHLLCHGTPLGDETGSFGLLLAPPPAAITPEARRAASRVTGSQLAERLSRFAGSLRAVVLCACHGSAFDARSHLEGVAQAVHACGFEAVLASRLPLTFDGSNLLADVFHRALLAPGGAPPTPFAPGSLEAAVVAARRALVEIGGLDWAALQLYSRASGGHDTRPFTFRPYRGLRAFQEAHAWFFCGRGRDRALLQDRVAEAHAGGRPRFQIVAGASGTGKSSLVLAHLVPAMRALDWACATFMPGKEPVRELRRAVARLHPVREGPPPGSAAAPASEDDVLAALRRLRQEDERPALLVIDQLEEVLTQASPAERQPFLRAVDAITRDASLRVVVVATVRIDAFGAALDARMSEKGGPSLYDVFVDERHTMLLPQIGAADFEDIIAEPARRVGLSLEPGLVTALLRDLDDEPGGLPLLELTLDRLWEKRSGRTLTHAAYEALGRREVDRAGERVAEHAGMHGVLLNLADELVRSLERTPEVLQQTKSILVQLVDLRLETALDTRRRAWFDDATANEPVFAQALAALRTTRMVVVGRDTPPAETTGDPRAQGAGTTQPAAAAGMTYVDLAHEVLIQRWPALRAWIEEDRPFWSEVRELAESARRWREERGDLLTGKRLEKAAQLARARPNDVPRPVRDFVAASVAQRQQEARQRRKGQIWGSALVIAVLSVLIGAVVWIRLPSEAERRREWDARLMAEARNLLNVNDHLAATVLLREVNDPTTREWRQLALDAVANPVPMMLAPCPDCTAVAISADGTRLAMLRKDGKIDTAPADGRGFVSTLTMGKAGLESIAWSHDGTVLSGWGKEPVLRAWRASDGAELPAVALPAPASAVSFAPGKVAIGAGRNIVFGKVGQGGISVEKTWPFSEKVTSLELDSNGERLALLEASRASLCDARAMVERCTRLDVTWAPRLSPWYVGFAAAGGEECPFVRRPRPMREGRSTDLLCGAATPSQIGGPDVCTRATTVPLELNRGEDGVPRVEVALGTWAFRGGTPLHGAGRVADSSFTADGSVAATLSHDADGSMNVRAWGLLDARRTPRTRLSTLDHAPTDRVIVRSDASGQRALVLDPAGEICAFDLRGPKNGLPRCMAWPEDLVSFVPVSAGSDGTADDVWGHEVPGRLASVDFGRTADEVMVASEQGRVCFLDLAICGADCFDAPHPDRKSDIEGDSYRVEVARTRPGTGDVFLSYANGSVCLWRMPSPGARVWCASDLPGFDWLEPTPDGRLVLAGSGTGSAALVDAETGNVAQHGRFEGSLVLVTLGTGSGTIATSDLREYRVSYDPQDPLLRQQPGTTSPKLCALLAVAPDGAVLCGTRQDQHITELTVALPGSRDTLRVRSAADVASAFFDTFNGDLVMVLTDGTLHRREMSPDRLKQRLWDATTVCLNPERWVALGASRRDAEARYADCNRRFGRAPAGN